MPDGARPVGADGESSAPRPRIERPSGEVERPVGSARLPGARRDGYTKLPTGPVGIEPVVVSGPQVDAVGDVDPGWEPSDGTPSADDTRLAPWALFAAVVALITSFFVSWGLPIAVIAVIAAIMSLRRPVESRAVARWALVLGLAATVYSLGWLVWAGMQFEQLG
ncbi:hypothetical protein [Streptomyces sp. AC495_CC817]|uniref:hypothetical protein n=1 Tax=Streptomyces sp. AC495_CC817 TaxID=2823900 RepID=UPI001C26CDEC|nr:hypothetical protein [Streptomyces sp. AC495_CC817]